MRKAARFGLVLLGAIAAGCVYPELKMGEATGGTATIGATSSAAGATNSGGFTSTGGNKATGGASTAATGGATAAGGGTTLGCTSSVAPATALIADFSAGATATGLPLITGGTWFTFGPSLALANGALQVTLDAPPTTTAQYKGFGIYFNNCVDASAYAGVKFDISGTVTGCPMFYVQIFREDVANAINPMGSCTASSCYAPEAQVTVTSTIVTTSISFAAMLSGAPVPTVDKQYLIGVQWQFNVPAKATVDCVATVTIDNVTFY